MTKAYRLSAGSDFAVREGLVQKVVMDTLHLLVEKGGAVDPAMIRVHAGNTIFGHALHHFELDEAVHRAKIMAAVLTGRDVILLDAGGKVYETRQA